MKLPESRRLHRVELTAHPQPAGAAPANNTKAAGAARAVDGGHIALIVPDMAKAVAIVKAKPAWKDYSRAAQQESHVA